MSRVLLVILLIGSVDLAAEIYKWVDAEGRTQFSDRPQPNAETIEYQEAKPAAAGQPAKPAGHGATGPLLGPYAGFEIVAPEPNQTIHQETENLSVSLLMDPPLLEGQQLQIVLDRTAPISVERTTGTQFSLTGVKFGTHRTYAQILDPQGAVVARTVEVTFHLRKPIPPGVLQ